MIIDVVELATIGLTKVVLCGNFQKLCVTHMAICILGSSNSDYLNKNFTTHSDVHLGWIEANAMSFGINRSKCEYNFELRFKTHDITT